MRVALVIGKVVAGVADIEDEKYLTQLKATGAEVVPIENDSPVTVGDFYENGEFVLVDWHTDSSS